MINIDGKLFQNNEAKLEIDNRGFQFGDAVFETIRVVQGKILFWEEHYFRLMASMRILRMEIPMNFTLEYLQEEIYKTLKCNNLNNSNSRIKLTVNRASGGRYLPLNKGVNFIITSEPLAFDEFRFSTDHYEVELFKDYFVSPGLLSTVKTNNRLVNILGSIFANENDFENCLLLNTNKMVIEALNGNLFLVKGQTVKTPPISDGCLKGIMRQQIIQLINEDEQLTLEESSISPFELQKADELFITNAIIGIQPISKYRKKEFGTEFASILINKLNDKVEQLIV